MKINNSPKRIQVQPTDRCNLNCRFCWITNSNQKNNSYDELPLSRWKEVSEEIAELSPDRLIVSGGGEPLVRKNVVREFIENLKNVDIYTSLITNGTLFGEELIKSIVENGWDHVVFSLHAPYASRDDFLRGKKGTFGKGIENIQRIKHFKDKYGTEKPTLAATSVINEYNFDLLDELSELINSLNIGPLTLRLLQNPGNLCGFPNEKYIPELKDKIEEIKDNNDFIELEFKIEDLLYYYRNSGQRMKNKGESEPFCYSPFFEMTIFATGVVAPCCYLNKQDYVGTSNLSGKTLREIWFGKDFENLRERLMNNDPPEACKNCSVSPEEMEDLESVFDKLNSQ